VHITARTARRNRVVQPTSHWFAATGRLLCVSTGYVITLLSSCCSIQFDDVLSKLQSSRPTRIDELF